MRLRVPTLEVTESDHLTTPSTCLGLEPGEHLLLVAIGRVPGTPIAYMYGLASPDVESVEATFVDESVLRTSVVLGTYVVVHSLGSKPVALRGISASGTVTECRVDGEANLC